jgi:hypothetical protein
VAKYSSGKYRATAEARPKVNEAPSQTSSTADDHLPEIRCQFLLFCKPIAIFGIGRLRDAAGSLAQPCLLLWTKVIRFGITR